MLVALMILRTLRYSRNFNTIRQVLRHFQGGGTAQALDLLPCLNERATFRGQPGFADPLVRHTLAVVVLQERGFSGDVL
jgi:hypothetical protein